MAESLIPEKIEVSGGANTQTAIVAVAAFGIVALIGVGIYELNKWFAANDPLATLGNDISTFFAQPGSALYDLGAKTSVADLSGDQNYNSAKVIVLTNATAAQINDQLAVATSDNTTTIVRDINSAGQTISTSGYSAAPVVGTGPGSIAQPYPVSAGWKGNGYYINSNSIVTAYFSQVAFNQANGFPGVASWLGLG